ncbi:MAG: extracellular solute-binding protein [Chloroflexi bacterium]|nr:extracellular solute-binding protein [Chloroflexota bacterium]
MRNSINVAIVGLLLFAVSLQGCGSQPELTRTPAAGPKEGTPALSTKPAWEKEWEDTLGAARKEGEVTVYTTYGPAWRVAMSELMSKEYGIVFNVLYGRSDELMERIWREQRNKLYQVDAVQAISSKRYIAEGEQLATILQPLEQMLVLPEVLDPKAWVVGKIPWADPVTKNMLFWRDALAVPLMVNTDMVGPQEIKVWDDLLNPKWKGKIILSDPTIGGNANSVMTMLAWSIKGWDFVNRLLQQEPIVLRDYRLMAEWVARAKYPIMIGPRQEEVQEFIGLGAPVKYVNFQDGIITTYGAGTIAVVKGSPHPAAAKIFLNFLLSKEGQTLTAKLGGYPSARVDVPNADFLDPATLRQPGMKAFSSEDVEYMRNLDQTNQKLKQLLAPLMKS